MPSSPNVIRRGAHRHILIRQIKMRLLVLQRYRRLVHIVEIDLLVLRVHRHRRGIRLLHEWKLRASIPVLPSCLSILLEPDRVRGGLADVLVYVQTTGAGASHLRRNTETDHIVRGLLASLLLLVPSNLLHHILHIRLGIVVFSGLRVLEH